MISLDLFLRIRKISPFHRNKTAKGVDNPMRVCHSLASSLNVFEKRFSPSLKISQPINVGTRRKHPVLRDRCKQIVLIDSKKIWFYYQVNFLNECDDPQGSQELNWRVWSWLRLNAGGMPYTCKSNGSTGACTWWRVANGWVIHRNVPYRGG